MSRNPNKWIDEYIQKYHLYKIHPREKGQSAQVIQRIVGLVAQVYNLVRDVEGIFFWRLIPEVFRIVLFIGLDGQIVPNEVLVEKVEHDDGYQISNQGHGICWDREIHYR